MGSPPQSVPGSLAPQDVPQPDLLPPPKDVRQGNEDEHFQKFIQNENSEQYS